MSIFLNGFKIELSAQTFRAYVQDMPNNQDVKPLREALRNEWFFHWRKGKMYGIPKVGIIQIPFGQPEDLACNDHLQLLANRISDLLPVIFQKYDPLKRNPFIFLAQRKEKELISAILHKIHGLPEIISSFKIFPKYILEPKIFELNNDEVALGLFLRLKTSWQIQTSLSSLQREGVDLQDLYVVRRHRVPGQRGLVGRIERLVKDVVQLSESFDQVNSIHEEEVWLEGSKVSFSRCLKTILGDRYADFESVCTEQESQLLVVATCNTN
ncbi:hypothetical protein, partial [Nostoc sp.]